MAIEWPSLWLLAIVAISIWLFLLATYRIFLHPLSQYPGPLLWKLSIWPTVWQCYHGKRHLVLLNAHRKYGPVVRIAPNMLSFDTGSSARAIYGHRQAHLVKSDFHTTLDATISSPSIFALIDKDVHAFRRRVIAQAFTERALRESNNIYLRFTHRLVAELQKKAASPTPRVNMGDYATWWAVDATGKLCLGTDFQCLTKPTYRHGIPFVRSGAQFTYWAGHLPFRKLIDYVMAHPLLQYLSGPSALDNKNYFDFCETALNGRIQEEDKDFTAGVSEEDSRKDYIHYLLNATDPETGDKLSHNALKTDVSLLLAAGSDAIATTLAAIMFNLARHPRCRDLAAAEVHKTFTSDHEIQVGPELSSCTYLTACIFESLRMTPFAAGPLERVTTHNGVVIDGNHIPPGVTVGTHFFSLNYNPALYSNPYEFWPERWLVDETGINGLPKDRVEETKKNFFPFSNGHRQCPGRKLAMNSLSAVLAALLWHFDFKVPANLGPDEPSGEGEMKGIFGISDATFSISQGPVVELIPRSL